MTFPHSESQRQLLNEAARRAIESHNQPEQNLDTESREMREKEHTGVELTEAELVYLKKMTFDRLQSVEGKISALERSLGEDTAANSDNAREELLQLQKESDFLQHNLVEKLFKKQEGAIH